MMLACLVVRTASEAKLPNSVLIRMLFNIALDFVVGLIPIIGDLADIAYKVRLLGSWWCPFPKNAKDWRCLESAEARVAGARLPCMIYMLCRAHRARRSCCLVLSCSLSVLEATWV
jgi:hypothetical protein